MVAMVDALHSGYMKLLKGLLGSKKHYIRGIICHVTLKFPSTYRFLWGHELANSFLLLRLHSSFLQRIMNFSFRQRLNFLLMLL